MKGKIQTDLYELLVQSMERTLEPAEEARLQTALEQDEQLQLAAQQLKRFKALGEKGTFEFRPFFTGRVMHRIEELAETDKGLFYGLDFAFKRLALPAFGLMLGLITLTWFQEQSFSIEVLTGLSTLSYEDIMLEAFGSI